VSIQETETFAQRVTSETPRLRVRNNTGAILVRSGIEGQITVQALKKVADSIFGAPREEDLAKIELLITQEGDAVNIAVKLDAAEALYGKSAAIDLLISAPPQTSCDLRLNAGMIEISGMTGRVAGRVNAGNIALKHAMARDVAAEINAGNFQYHGPLAPDGTLDVEVNIGNAQFYLPADTAMNLDAQTVAGQINFFGFSHLAPRPGKLQEAHFTHPDAKGRLLVRVNTGNIDLNSHDIEDD